MNDGENGPLFGDRWAELRRTAPMTRAFNHLIAGTHFAQRFGRWPLPPEDARATVNDLIFARMIDPAWSPLQRAFVDKETAKDAARRLLPDILVPRTLAVVAMAAVASAGDLFERLRPFGGMDAIAKPAHASGAATFMRDIRSVEDVRLLHGLAAMDYALVMREMQYWRLPRKVIVEEMIAAAPDDYKFHCVHGEPVACQVDHARFGRPWSRLLTMPDFTTLDPADGLAPPPTYRRPTAARLAGMVAAARALAAPFDFVRVDLYDGADGIYFGELTFTPSAALGVAPSAAGDHAVNDTHRLYSRLVMAAFRAGPGAAAERRRRQSIS